MTNCSGKLSFSEGFAFSWGGPGMELHRLGDAKKCYPLVTPLARGKKKSALLTLFWNSRDGTQEGTKCLQIPKKKALAGKAG